MGKCLFMRKGETHTAPSKGIMLSEIAEGSVVKLRENGSPVEFYVAKHNYEPTLNGTGRTLLVRKELSERNCECGYYSDFVTLEVATWLNSEYKASLDSRVQTAIGETNFYASTFASITNGKKDVVPMSASVFLLSITEMGLQAKFNSQGTGGQVNTEGTILPISSILQQLTAKQLTRSGRADASADLQHCASGGNVSTEKGGVSSSYRTRPCFTLPDTALFGEKTLEFRGVA